MLKLKTYQPQFNQDVWDQNEEAVNNLVVQNYSETPQIKLSEELRGFNGELSAFSSYLRGRYPNLPVKFYMWVDELAQSLCYSAISKFEEGLPFGCKIIEHTSLQDWLNHLDEKEVFQPISLDFENMKIIPLEMEDDSAADELVLHVFSKVFP